jgi:apolipoprotein N-acyltransferase
MDLLKDLKIDHWWKLIAVAGALLAIAATPVQFAAGGLVGLGILFFGAGEWINHPVQQSIGMGYGSVWKGTSYPWNPRPLGIVLDALGILLFFIGLIKIIIA